MTRKLGDMDFSLFKKIINEGKDYLEFVWLQNYGEPLLNNDVFKMIKYCNAHNIKTGISTNATVLTEFNAIRLLDSGLSEIIFAFDGATKETYEQVRVGADYETVRNNILNFLRIKTEKKSKIFVVLQCINMSATQNDVGTFKKAWSVQGVDAIRIRQVTYSISRNNGDEKIFVNDKRKFPCYWLWRNPHINYDGTLIPCCQDVNADLSLGNLKNHTLLELWNSEKMQSLRKALIDEKYDQISICKDCNMYQPAITEILGSFYLSVGTLNKIIPLLETLKSKVRYRGKI